MSPQLDRLSAPRTRKGSRRRRLGVRLTNPLREICTVGSVREESPKRHDGPKRARSWKRRRQPRKVYSASGLLYSAAREEVGRHSGHLRELPVREDLRSGSASAPHPTRPPEIPPGERCPFRPRRHPCAADNSGESLPLSGPTKM